MLTETQIDSLQILLTNDHLLSAVKRVFEEATEVNRPQIMPTDDNKLLGERYRAYENAKNIIETAFTSLNSYKKGKKVENNINRAR